MERGISDLFGADINSLPILKSQLGIISLHLTYFGGQLFTGVISNTWQLTASVQFSVAF